MPSHEDHARLNALIGRNRKWVAGHHFFDSRYCRIKALHHNPLHQIAFRENAYHFPVSQYWHGADIPIDHRLSQLQHGLRNVGSISFLVLYQIIDARHAAPPGPNGKTTHVSGLLTGAEYMTDSCRVKAIIASLTGIYAPGSGQNLSFATEGGTRHRPPVYTTI